VVGGVEDRIEGSGHDAATGLADRCDGYATTLTDRFNIDRLAGAAISCRRKGKTIDFRPNRQTLY
jgi:hypothetical protein